VLNIVSFERSGSVPIQDAPRTASRRVGPVGEVAAFQGEGERYEARAVEGQIQGEQQADNPEAVHGPAGEDDQSDQDGDDAARQYPAPPLVRLQPDRGDDPQDAGGNEAEREQQRENGGGE